MNINKIILMGRVTADIELKMANGDLPVVQFTVAVNRQGKDAGVDFIDCVAFRKTAEFIKNFFRKGSAIIVFGSLRVESYTDKEGKKRRSERVMISEVQFGESRKDAPVSKNEDIPANNPNLRADFEEIPEDDLPF